MRLELTRVGLLVELANHYTTRGALQQLCDDKGCNPKDLPEAMNDRETWRERIWDIRASRTTG